MGAPRESIIEKRLVPSLQSDDDLQYVGVGQVVGALMRSHPSRTNQPAIHLFKIFAMNILKPKDPKNVCSAPVQKFALDHIATYFEVYGLKGIEDMKENLYTALFDKCYSKFWVLDHQALLNLAKLTELMGQDFLVYASETFELLFDLQDHKLDGKEDDGSSLLREVLLVVWGRVLQVLYKHYDKPEEEVFIKDHTMIWVRSLPIKYDQKESSKQHKFYCELLQSYPKLLWSTTPSENSTLLQPLVAVYRTAYSDKETDQEIIELFKGVKQSGQLLPILSQLENTLPTEDKDRLKAILSEIN
jgi:hypothetical protein